MTLKIGVGLFTGQIPKSSGRTYTQEYADCLSLVRLVEEHGLDSAWVSEHHFSEDGYLPSLVVMLSAFAAVTSRIELGTGVVLAPFHDPVRLAEDFAVVDQLSGGRVICGLGIGWRDEEFRAFDIDPKSRTKRLSEIVTIMRGAWADDRLSFHGKYYDYESVAVTPKPARVPPILIGGFADAAIKRAGRIGDGYISSRAQPERIREAFEMASAEWKKAGKSGAPVVALLQNAFITEDPERDWPLVAAGAGHQLGVYAGWRAGTDVEGKPLKVMPPDGDDLRRTTAFGTPKDVVAYLRETAELLSNYPESHLILRLHYPGMDAEPAARAIELLGKEVAPALRTGT
ncbi:MAG: LLM class flavin-dependent oxidoreductase [Actinomycetota bacterium]